MSTRTVFRAAFAVAFSLSLLCIVLPAQSAQRTFVSTSGNDANACSIAAPCRGFAKAITVTDPGGELVVLDSGGYGFVTVNKNVTIVSPAGVYAGISVFAAQDGITVTAPATRVVLRGLTINGQGGNNGIRVQAGEVHVEGAEISNLAQAGILVEGGSSVRISGTVSRSNVDGLRVVPGAGAISVLVRDSEFSNNATAGIGVSPSAGGTNAQVTVERSSVAKNGAGVVASPGGSAAATVIVTQSVASENAGAGVSSVGSTATVFVRESAVTRNGTGLLQASSGVLNACGANLLVANAVPQSGAIVTTSCLDVASASGTVTSVGTGAGLIGGPITASGTVNLAATNLLPTIACGTSQVPQWNGSAWICASAALLDGSGNLSVAGTVIATPVSGSQTALRGNSTNNIAVLGINQSAASGVAGEGGVYGLSSTGFGVAGASSSGDGVKGYTATGYAGHFFGPVKSTGTISTDAGLQAVASVTGGWNNPVVYVENTNTGANTGPAIRAIANGDAPNGALSVSTQGTGLIARFGNTTAWVAQLDVAGNLSATSFNPTSDRDAKQNFRPVRPHEVLERLVSLPIARWNFKADPEIEHIGPMAQDFQAAFEVGTDDRHIATVDADGVAFAAIQALYDLAQDKDREITELRNRVASLEALSGELTALRSAVSAMSAWASAAAHAH